MNVYDFDGTIYDGDSTVDFLKYMYRKHPGIMLPRVFSQCLSLCAYLCRRITKEQMKERFFSFLSDVENIDEVVSAFWDEHIPKVKRWFYREHRWEDVVISASPEFLLREFCRRLRVLHLIATIMDPQTGKINGKNCRGSEKPNRFYEEFPDGVIDNFYSDHPSDVHMAKLAEKAWLVKGKTIRPWKV